MKKRLLAVLSVILTFMMMGSTFSFAAQVNPVEGDTFTDVAADSWYKEYVDFVAENAYMIGTSETTFEPESNLTRAMFATILARYHGADVDDSKETIFNDVPVNQWYTGSIGWNNEKSIVQGYGDGNFGTNDFITRQDLATMIARYIDVYEADFGKIHQSHRPMIDYEFADAADIADYAVDTIKTCVDYGLLEGYPDKTFKPRQNITRAETAAIIYRLAWLTPGPVTPGSSSKYVVTATVGKNGKTFDMTAEYSAYQAKRTTVPQIMRDLIADTKADKNQENITKAIQSQFIDKFRDGGPKQEEGMAVAVQTTKDGLISIKDGQLSQILADEVELYENRMARVGEKAGIADAAAWDAFVAAFSPDNFYEPVGYDIKLLTAEEYYDAFATAVNATADLYDEVGKAADLAGVLEAAEAAGMDLGVKFNTVGGSYEVLGTTVAAPTDLDNNAVVDYLAADNQRVLFDLVKDGKTTVLDFSEAVTSAQDVADIVNDRISRDWSSNGAIMSVLQAVEEAYTGTYTFTVKVEKK